MDEGATIDRASHRFKWLVVGYVGGMGISALVTILLARLMEPANYGLYAISFLVPTLLIGINTLGFESATTFFVAKFFSSDAKKADTYFKTAIIFTFLYALLLSTILSLLAGILAVYLFNKSLLTNYLRVSSFLILAMSLNSVVNGGLIARGEQKTVAIFILYIATQRNILALLLYARYMDPFYAVLGQTLGQLSAGSLYWLYAYEKVSKSVVDFDALKNMLSYAVPYGIGMFITVICTQLFNFVAAITFNDFVYGNFSAAWLIMSGIMTIPTSLSTSFFPSFTEAELRQTNVSTVYNSAIKFSATLLLYLWLIFGSLADFFIKLIYGAKYDLAAGIFAMLSSVFVLSILGWGIINPLLLSLKKTRVLAIISGISVAISLTLYLFLMKSAFSSLWAIPIAFFVLHLITTILGLYYLKKNYKLIVDKKTVIKFIGIVLLLFVLTRKMGFTIGGTLMAFIGVQISSVITILISVFIIGALYIFVLIATGTIGYEDYRRIKNAFFKWYLEKLADRIAEPAFKVRDKINGSLVPKIKKLAGGQAQKVFREDS